ncbi:bifunctional diguanylate cyclase/phosphodiesterase [Oribacterium sp. C9]|uniref:bifunctional diguanylate cyclase/phosphodiesterase n=1 Tax=Oribacterium sp. C9 TaxID=1943579 RepID=UPI00098E8E75|nr:bifunctional diguanylate cyclase/phosphodiesterase [Oribacterium sp. C9]
MKKRGFLRIARGVFFLIGIVCFMITLIMLAYQLYEKDSYRIDKPHQADHKVLFLCSYDPMYFTYKYQIEGLEDELYSNGIEFDVVYMDTKKFRSEDDLKEFYHFFRQRYEKNSKGFEGILLGDDDALIFAIDHQEDLFDGLPMVFFGVNDLGLAHKAETNPYITGFYENNFLDQTFMTAIKLFPDHKNLVSIHDDSAAGKSDINQFYALKNEYSEYSFDDIDTSLLTKRELIETLRVLPSDTLLFYMTCYNDCQGNVHSLYDSTSVIVNNTDVPIFRNYAEGRDSGVLGGTYMDFYTQARDAAHIMSDVINKKSDISKYDLSLYTPGITEFNYPLMKKYGISTKQLPSDTVFYGKPVTFYELYKNMLPVVFFMAVSLVSFIISAFLALKNEKRQVRILRSSKEQLLNSQNKLVYQANHDELLDLLNRRSIVEYLSNNLKNEQIYSVLMIDIDGFKDINENYGHQIGDKILVDISDTLKRYAEKNNMILGRYGGDEFLMLFKNKRLDSSSLIVKGIVTLFNKPFGADNVNVMLSASIGISNSDRETTPEQHIINAEIAMYEAKARGKNMVFVYAEDMKNKLIIESTIKAAFLEAFDSDGFYLMYQPKVSASTKEVIGYEALIRLRDYPYGPGAFIPVIEKSGWTIKLGRLITRLVVEQIYKWKSQGIEIHPVSINFSSRQIHDLGYCDYLQSLLYQYKVDPKYVQIEITETLLLEESSRTTELFDKFRRMNIKLLLDDFGTGYSSLAYLTYVPVDDVKLDKSLVDTYLCAGKEAFIKDVIQLVHDMGKTITIEGVEHEWQYLKLAEFKADTIQGYYFSKPLKPDEAIRYRAI